MKNNSIFLTIKLKKDAFNLEKIQIVSKNKNS